MAETPREVVPLHRLEVPAPHGLPFAIGSFDSIGPQSRAAYPHRHTFHEIVYVTGGRGGHVIDVSRWPLRPPHLCFIAPGQIHYWQRVRGLHGWVVLFDDAFLLAHPGDRELLRGLGERPWLRLDAASAADIEPLLTGMRREYGEQRQGTVSVLQSYLHILVVRASRLAAGGGDRRSVRHAGRRHGAAGDLSRRFVRMLDRSGPAAGTSVREWAAELGVSVGYLNEAVKSATGRTPGQLIRQAQVLEAKRLLAGTGLTVGRVAREAGFTDAAYFCRFFRRETGLSPGEFRRDVQDTQDTRGAQDTGRNHHADRTPSIDHADRSP